MWISLNQLYAHWNYCITHDKECKVDKCQNMPTFHIYTYWVLKHCLYLSTCYRSRAQELEDEQERIDRELRKLLDKPGEITVESLEFVVAHFSSYSWIALTHIFTISMKTNMNEQNFNNPLKLAPTKLNDSTVSLFTK